MWWLVWLAVLAEVGPEAEVMFGFLLKAGVLGGIFKIFVKKALRFGDSAALNMWEFTLFWEKKRLR